MLEDMKMRLRRIFQPHGLDKYGMDRMTRITNMMYPKVEVVKRMLRLRMDRLGAFVARTRERIWIAQMT